MHFDTEIPMLWRNLLLPSSAAMHEGAIQIKGSEDKKHGCE
jgi:hypothetical protein